MSSGQLSWATLLISSNVNSLQLNKQNIQIIQIIQTSPVLSDLYLSWRKSQNNILYRCYLTLCVYLYDIVVKNWKKWRHFYWILTFYSFKGAAKVEVGSEIIAIRSNKVVLDNTIGPAEIIISDGKIVNVLPKRNWAKSSGEKVCIKLETVNNELEHHTVCYQTKMVEMGFWSEDTSYVYIQEMYSDVAPFILMTLY